MCTCGIPGHGTLPILPAVRSMQGVGRSQWENKNVSAEVVTASRTKLPISRPILEFIIAGWNR